MRRKLTRRRFLQVSALATAGAVMAACGPKMTEEPVEETEEPVVAPETEKAAAPTKFKEAPDLAALVSAGELPPVDERLPLNPYIAQCRESIGKYGGGIRRGFKGVSDRWGPTKHIDRCLVWFDENLRLVPRIIESWSMSDDAKTLTLHLRKGMKWSDGTDFTSEAFRWYYEYQIKNKDLMPAPPGSHSTRDEEGKAVLCEMEYPDDYTVVHEPRAAHGQPVAGRKRAF